MRDEKYENDRLNIQEISKLANVSTATVSRVLNNSSHVSEVTREKVLEVMRKTNYRPNVFAQSLKRDRTKTVGIMCPETMDVYVARSIFYVQRELGKNNYSALLNCTGYELEDKKKGMALLLGKRVDAIVLIGSSFREVNPNDNDYIIQAAEHVPIIWINGKLDSPNIYGAYCDDLEAVYRAAKGLFRAGLDGKRTIYMYDHESYSNKCKINGCLTAMLECDQPIFENSITLCPLECVDQVMDKLFKNPEETAKIGAVMTSGDRLAVRVLRYLRLNGIRVPEQVQVIGYSNSEFGSYCVPELTSIDSCVEELSKEAVKILLKVLDGETMEENKVFKARIIPRESTRAALGEMLDHVPCSVEEEQK